MAIEGWGVFIEHVSLGGEGAGEREGGGGRVWGAGWWRDGLGEGV